MLAQKKCFPNRTSERMQRPLTDPSRLVACFSISRKSEAQKGPASRGNEIRYLSASNSFYVELSAWLDSVFMAKTLVSEALRQRRILTLLS
jgi:hypothetical protein